MAENKKNKKVAKAKLKPEEGKSKPSPEETDEFVAGINRFAAKLKPHAVRIGVGIGLVAALLIAFVVYSWVKDRAAARATDAFSSAVEVAQRPVIEPVAGEEPPPGARPSFPSATKRAEAVLARTDAVEAGGGVGAATSLVRGRALLELGRHAEAAKAFATAAKGDLPRAALISAREGIGYAYEAEAEATEDAGAREQALERALAAFKSMQPAESGPRRDHALYHQARILAVLGKRDDARQTYRQILETLPDTELKMSIESRLSSLGGAE